MAESGAPFLRVRGVHKAYPAPGGRTVALNGVDLDIADREFMMQKVADGKIVLAGF